MKEIVGVKKLLPLGHYLGRKLDYFRYKKEFGHVGR